MNPLKRPSPLATGIFAGALAAGVALAEPVLYERIMHKPEQRKSDPISMGLLVAGVAMLEKTRREIEGSMDTFYISGDRIIPGSEIDKLRPM